MLKLNLQFFGEGEEVSEGWDDIVDTHEAEQPQEDSETETEEEPSEEVETEDESTDTEDTEEVEEDDSDEESEPTEDDESDEEEQDESDNSEDDDTEESESETSLSEDTEIEVGEDTVSLKELKDGYLRQSDYTKKTQELAEQRKELEPTQEWMEYWTQNPYLKEQIMSAIQEWENTGFVPIEKVLDGSEHGQYVNHLLQENQKLQQQLDDTNTKFKETEFESNLTQLKTSLKDSYGELVTDEYIDTLRQRGKDEGLSYDVLKEIADGQLSKKQLEQERKQKQKQAAKQKKEKKSKRLPPQPKPKGQTPKETSTSDGWDGFFGVDD